MITLPTLKTTFSRGHFKRCFVSGLWGQKWHNLRVFVRGKLHRSRWFLMHCYMENGIRHCLASNIFSACPAEWNPSNRAIISIFGLLPVLIACVEFIRGKLGGVVWETADCAYVSESVWFVLLNMQYCSCFKRVVTHILLSWCFRSVPVGSRL